MSVVEGYSEHVMDAIAARVHPGARAAARRDGPAPPEPLGAAADHRAAARLRREAAPVRAGQALRGRGGRPAGIEGLNRVWSSPAALPSPDELQHPEQWLKRTEPAASAA